uniref:Uncharacterized protein n=1 Tax=Ciona savignyi TaxID=51511 RepID=H2ZF73_CIOSA
MYREQSKLDASTSKTPNRSPVESDGKSFYDISSPHDTSPTGATQGQVNTNGVHKNGKSVGNGSSGDYQLKMLRGSRNVATTSGTAPPRSKLTNGVSNNDFTSSQFGNPSHISTSLADRALRHRVTQPREPTHTGND